MYFDPGGGDLATDSVKDEREAKSCSCDPNYRGNDPLIGIVRQARVLEKTTYQFRPSRRGLTTKAILEFR